MQHKIEIKPGHIITIVLCCGINLLCGYLFTQLDLPFRFYMIGTMIAAAIFGPITSAVTALITGLVLAFTGEITMAYVVQGLLVGLLSGIVIPHSDKPDPFRVVSAGVLSGFVMALIATPLNIYYNNGSTRNTWGDGLITLLSNHINFKSFTCFLGEAFIDIPELVISALIAVTLARLIAKMSEKKTSQIAMMLIVMIIAGQFSIPVKAVDVSSDYMGIKYDTDDGLVSAEINAVAQTSDGYIWAGAYSGLYRCDGVRFVRMDIDERISSVLQLFADSKGRLWIGTNESGLGCYDPKDDSIVFYDMSMGLAANAIREIAEDASGNIYVGTIAELSIISPDGKISVVEDEAASNCRSMIVNDAGMVVGVSNYGTMFFYKDGKVIYSSTNESETGSDYAAVGEAPGGTYIVGTSGNQMMRFRIVRDKPAFFDTISTGEVAYQNAIIYNNKLNGYFFCCENGFGFIADKDDKITLLSTEDFGSSISDVIIDYQENIWFASNKQGVMRFSWNPFQDVFAGADVIPDVVNALLIDRDLLYVGANNGLVILNTKSNTVVRKSLARHFDGVRIRHLSKDRKGNIWVSTYGMDGLVRISPKGELTAFNEFTKGTEGSRFRLAMECSDGTIAAATSSGLSFIEKDEVVAKLGASDGIGAQILSMEEKEDGTIVAGTDGDGVLFIKDRKIVSRLGEADGFNSLVILRVVPDGDGFFYVTSNALYYDDGSHKVRKLSNFPYANNYDIYLPGDGTAWITSSAGIYVVNKADLIEDGEYSYTLLNRRRGLYTTLTANAKYAVKGDELYLCCTDGVRKVSVTEYNTFDNKYGIRLAKLTVGEEEIKEEDGVYHIPPSSERLKFDVAVLNFTLSNPLIRIFLDDAGDSGITSFQNEIAPLSYTNLPYGDYTLRVQVLDENDGEVVREADFTIEKEAQIFETPIFIIYLILVGALFVVYIIWLFYTLRANAYRMKTLQKEATTDAMTGLLNKAASIHDIGELCKSGNGILMMIDLDSFKLVNDIYGHEMGDRILIRFAELIKACIRSTDLAGRMGGDEFIAYIRNTTDESFVESKTVYINRELVKSAKEYMGEDMNIPLGASIGAVRVPAEGADFDDLFKKADKALYNVKQNGKHGYAIYCEDSKEENDDAEKSVSRLDEIAMILGERNMGRGAYKIDFEKMEIAYRLLMRLGSRYELNVQLVEYVITPEDENEVLPDDILDQFEEKAAENLRKNDIIARHGKGRFIVLLSEIATSNAAVPIDRIMSMWKEEHCFDGYKLSYEDTKII